MNKLTEAFIERLKTVKGKRALTVVNHIREHGYITSEELENTYGYDHPPRAVRDAREQGIPIETYRVKSSDGRSIAAYRFGDYDAVADNLAKKAGRTALSKALKKALIGKYGSKCFIYLQEMAERQLQVDHRVPYEIGGEHGGKDIDSYMLLSPSANRAKSWTCEHCPNWTVKDVRFCMKCFWAHPENYDHVAGEERRQIIITFTGNEIDDYNMLIKLAGREGAESTIKMLIDKYLRAK